MLLIRGFNKEEYAREIEKGQIGFRDLLTTLLYPENNGYKLSNYYEKSIIEAAAKTNVYEVGFEDAPCDIAQQLNLIFNPFVPHFYLSYFHILNERSEEWLERNFHDDSHFVYAIPKIQTLNGIDDMLYGPNMVGSKMIYFPKDGKANTPQMLIKKAGIAYLMQKEVDACISRGSSSLDTGMTLGNMITAVCCEAFARRCEGDFDNTENEFRLIYKTPTPYLPATGFFEPTESRTFSMMIDGSEYRASFTNILHDNLKGWRVFSNMLLEAKSPLAAEPVTSLKKIIDEGRAFKVLPYFKPVNIKPAFYHYGYIGNKEQCRRFISAKLKENA